MGFCIAMLAAGELLSLDPCDEFATEICIRASSAHDDATAARSYDERYAESIVESLHVEPADTFRSLFTQTAYHMERSAIGEQSSGR